MEQSVHYHTLYIFFFFFFLWNRVYTIIHFTIKVKLTPQSTSSPETLLRPRKLITFLVISESLIMQETENTLEFKLVQHIHVKRKNKTQLKTRKKLFLFYEHISCVLFRLCLIQVAKTFRGHLYKKLVSYSKCVKFHLDKWPYYREP